MVKSSQALAYLVDPADLARLFPDWPEEMGLALYLDAGGRCAAVPFCLEDRDRLGPRLTRIFAHPASEIDVFPKLDGHPKLALLYSDEQKLLAMLAEVDADKLLTTVRDVALNHRFALEEGLDPDTLVGGIHIPLMGAADADPIPDPKPQPIEPAALPVPEGDTPTGFVRLAPETRETCRTLPGVLIHDADGTLRLAPLDHSAPALPLPEAALFVRDDLKALALKLPEAFPDHLSWALPVERIPTTLVPALGAQRRVEISQIGQQLFVNFPPPRPRPAPELPVQTVHRVVTDPPPLYAMVQTPRRARWQLGGVFGFLTFVMILSGSVVAALS